MGIIPSPRCRITIKTQGRPLRERELIGLRLLVRPLVLVRDQGTINPGDILPWPGTNRSPVASRNPVALSHEGVYLKEAR